MNKKEFDSGYQAAIEAIRAALQGGDPGSTDDGGSSIPNDMTPPPVPNTGKKGNKKSNGATGGDPGGQPQGQSGRDDGNVGTVTPADTIGPDQLSDTPGTPGGFIDKEVGDEIAKKEGYPKEGGTATTVEKDWKDTAIKISSKLSGDQPGGLKSKLDAIYKTATDWKKELRMIVGHSISPEDRRQAYANKNVLVSQDRIARTDKDKYDNVDYIAAFIDSSGSMSDDQLRMCLAEVYSVALAKKPMRLLVLQCDTQIQEVKEYRNINDLKKEFKHATVKGRGGTELAPCWNFLKTDPKYRRMPAELVMVFTDGYMDQYKRDPRTMNNLCWVIIDNPSCNVKYKDIKTKMIHINSNDVK